MKRVRKFIFKWMFTISAVLLLAGTWVYDSDCVPLEDIPLILLAWIVLDLVMNYFQACDNRAKQRRLDFLDGKIDIDNKPIRGRR